MKVSVLYDEHDELVQDPDDDWPEKPYSYRGATQKTISDIRVVKDSSGKFEVPAEVGDRVFVVIARYGTGDTFGNEYGEVQVMDVFEDVVEANSLALDAENYTGKTDKSFMYNWDMEHNDRTYRINWLGYFEHLESVDVISCVLEPK